MAITMKSSYFEQHGLQLVVEKVFMVCDENGRRAGTEIFFSIPFESVLEPFVSKLESLYKWRPGMRGPGPYPPVAMFKAIVFAKLNKNMSDRGLERYLIRHPDVGVALGFDKIPSHQTFSYFKRERISTGLLDEIFNAMRDHLVAAGWVDFSSATIDSAPVKANVNLAKANKELKLNDGLAGALLDDPEYKSLATAVVQILPYKRSSPALLQRRVACLNLVVLYELGGFLSHTKVKRYLEKEERASLLASACPGGSIPSAVMMSTFKKHLSAVVDTMEFNNFHAFLQEFLANAGSPADCSADLFFPGLLAVLQESCAMTDQDARLGYCAAKKQVLLGYRVQLIVDDKKRSL